MHPFRHPALFSAACACLAGLLVIGDGRPARGDDDKPNEAAAAKSGAAAPAADVQPGHSAHGEAFDEGPRQAAYLMEGTGKIRFPVTTKDPQAQRFFEQGVGQLHGFWYFEAERSFRQAATLDPDCAMAYWGMAMANVSNEKRAKEFVKEAAKRKAKASPREVMWIDGLHEFYHGAERDEAKRRRKHIQSIEAIVQEHPDDVEAKAFLAWRIWDSRTKLPMTSLQAVDALLDQVFLAEPMHPAHHYRIHLWDEEKPARAAASAARLGQTSPAVAHMWHMPGHTYSKLRRHEDAAFHQEASARVDHARMARDCLMPTQIHNYAHNNEWCVRTLVSVGRVRDALDLARNLAELPRHPKHNAPAGRNSAASMGRERMLDVLAQHELWDQFLALADTVYLNGGPDETPDQQVRRLRYLGVAHAAKGNSERADEQVKALEAARKRAATRPTTGPATAPAANQTPAGEQDTYREPNREPSGSAAGPSDESDTPEKAGPPDKAEPAAEPLGSRRGPRSDRRPTTRPTTAPATSPTTPSEQGRSGRRGGGPGGGGNIASHVAKAVANIRGQQAFAAGDLKAAMTQFEKAGDLRKEHLSQAHLAAGNKDRALQLAREAADAAKDQCFPLANQVDVLFRSGKTAEAEEAFGRLRKLSGKIDLTAPVYARLAAAAKQFGHSADWRLARPLPPDVLPRPDLDALGPFRWQPSPAPAWSLPSADGKQLSLAEYRGKPVLVVFYLGYGCLHCVEQLNAFAPLAKEFEQAGVSIVAVSTDTRDGLSKSLATAKADGGYPFPLVSDEKLTAFRAYRAYDDFERSPMHGTFLVDGRGLVRWQDIGPRPFTDTKFLLAETKRLLAQPREETAGE